MHRGLRWDGEAAVLCEEGLLAEADVAFHQQLLEIEVEVELRLGWPVGEDNDAEQRAEEEIGLRSSGTLGIDMCMYICMDMCRDMRSVTWHRWRETILASTDMPTPM